MINSPKNQNGGLKIQFNNLVNKNKNEDQPNTRAQSSDVAYQQSAVLSSLITQVPQG